MTTDKKTEVVENNSSIYGVHLQIFGLEGQQHSSGYSTLCKMCGILMCMNHNFWTVTLSLGFSWLDCNKSKILLWIADCKRFKIKLSNWTASSEFGTYRLCEQRRFSGLRILVPLNGWACAVKICHDGMLKDTNSLDGAQFEN